MSKQTAVVGLLVIGFVLTAVNGIRGYRGARERLRKASQRVATSARYASEERGAQGEDTSADVRAETDYSAHEVLDVLNGVLRSTRTKLLLAGLGLLVSTAATIWDVLD